MAAQSRGSVNVFVQPENDSSEAMATEFLFLPFGQHLEKQLDASFVEFHVTEFVDAEQIHSAVAGDRAGELFLVGGFDEFVHQSGGEDVFDAVTVLGGRGAEHDE